MEESSNKTIAKNTILLYIRSILLLLIGLYTSRLTLQALGVSDYGIYQIVGGVVAMFSILSSTLNSASQRFITYSLGGGNKDEVKQVFSTCITLHIVLGVIVVVLLEIFGIWFLQTTLKIPEERIGIATIVMHLSIATFFFSVISVPYNAVIIAHERMRAFAYISLLEGVLRLICVSLLLVIDYDKLLLYAIFYFLIGLANRIVYSVYCAKNFEEARNVKLKIDKQLFGKMFSFAGWNLIGSGALVLRNQGIDILLNLFFGVTVNAAKGVSNQVQNAVQQLVGNFTTAVNPQLTKSIAQSDYKRAHFLINKGGKMAFFLVMIMAVPFIIYRSPIMSLWLKEVPKYAEELTVLSLIYLLTDTQSRFLINSILANGKIRGLQVTMGSIKLLAVPLTWLFLSQGGSPLTGLIVNIVLQFICLIGELFFCKHYVHLNSLQYLLNVLKCWFVFGISLTISYLFMTYVTTNLILGLLFSLLACVLVIYLIGFNKEEKQMVVTFVSSKIKKS